MKIIQPTLELLYHDPNAIQLIEKVARTCYKSEDKITEGSGDKLVRGLIKSGHEAMIEHSSITMRYNHNRGFTHELVRMRMSSFAQESTRYCNYSKEKFGTEITVIQPYWWNDDTLDLKQARVAWTNAIFKAEDAYFRLLKLKVPPNGARGVLPIDLKAEINITANMRQWRHILTLRADAAHAHPDMPRVMDDTLKLFYKLFPALFEDIYNLYIK